MEKGGYRRYACLGPGGWNCRCCTPAPAGPKMKKFLRIWKKRERRDTMNDVQQQLENHDGT